MREYIWTNDRRVIELLLLCAWSGYAPRLNKKRRKGFPEVGRSLIWSTWSFNSSKNSFFLNDCACEWCANPQQIFSVGPDVFVALLKISLSLGNCSLLLCIGCVVITGGKYMSAGQVMATANCKAFSHNGRNIWSRTKGIYSSTMTRVHSILRFLANKKKKPKKETDK